MGFIDRLRHTTEMEKAAEQDRLRKLRPLTTAHFETPAEMTARLHAEFEEHKARKQQAREFLQESGSGTLLYELSKITGIGIIYDFGPGVDGKAHRVGSPHPYSHLSDGYWRSLQLSRRGLVREKGDRKTMERYSGTYVAIEASFNGTIVVHGSKTEPLDLGRWRTNKDIIEEALERAYNIPGNYVYSYDFGGIESTHIGFG